MKAVVLLFQPVPPTGQRFEIFFKKNFDVAPGAKSVPQQNSALVGSSEAIDFAEECGGVRSQMRTGLQLFTLLFPVICIFSAANLLALRVR